MWMWFNTKRATGIPLTGPLIKAQALRFKNEFGKDKFNASNGWLRTWKNRYGIRAVNICGEKLSANHQAVDPFKEKFLTYIKAENITVDQVFNCDETGLNYKMLPKTTLCAKNEEPPSGLKGYKERVTVMACSNVSGTLKLPLVVIGKSAKPRALRNVNALPVSCKNQKSAWMTQEIFVAWFQKEFVPAVKTFLQAAGLPCKALLVMDNCSSHKVAIKVDDISVMYFPANTTSLIQPMDQGVLQNLKLLYKQDLMKFILDSIDKKLTLHDTLKKITIKEGIFWVAAAWDRLTKTTIQKSWNRVHINLV